MRIGASRSRHPWRISPRVGRIPLACSLVALESFVLARYWMFATIYFHHTTRAFERVLRAGLEELWPDPRVLDPIDEFLAWDDFRVVDAMRTSHSEAARSMSEVAT